MSPLTRTPVRASKKARVIQKKAVVGSRQQIMRNPISKQSWKTFSYTGVNLFTVSGGAGVQQFSCNGMYDPDISGVGTQPLYFDQQMAMFNHYVVVSSTCKVTLTDTNNRVTHAALYIEDDVSSGNDARIGSTRPGAVSRIANLMQGPATTLSKSWSAKDTFGGNPLSKSELRGNASSNPSEQSYFTLILNDISLGDQSYTVKYEITYRAMLSEFKTIAAS